MGQEFIEVYIDSTHAPLSQIQMLYIIIGNHGPQVLLTGNERLFPNIEMDVQHNLTFLQIIFLYSMTYVARKQFLGRYLQFPSIQSSQILHVILYILLMTSNMCTLYISHMDNSERTKLSEALPYASSNKSLAFQNVPYTVMS